MARWLKQSTSADVPIGPFLDATDGVTAETALTITQPDIRLKKNGAAWAQKNAAQTLSHEENGFYEVTLDATDTNTLGLLRLAVHESGALPIWEDFLVVPANVWDAFFGSDKLDVSVVELNGVAASAQNLERSASAIYRGSVTGAATTTTLVDSGLTQSGTDHWKGRIVIWTSGTLAFQATDITAFTPATDTLTFTALTAAPSGGDTYVIV